MLQQQSELLKKLSNNLTREQILSKPLLQYILDNKHFDQAQIQWLKEKLNDIQMMSNHAKISMAKENEQAQIQAIGKEQTQQKLQKKAIIEHNKEACLFTESASDKLSKKQGSKIKNILITGAAGNLGHILRLGLRGKFNLIRCLDIMPMQPAEVGQETIQSSLTDKIKLNEAMKNIDCIVHLAAIPTENEWSKILQSNIDGCFNTYDLAHRNQVKRFIFASSNHAIGFHQRSSTLNSQSITRPDSRYGVSKVLGQSLGRLYSDKHGMQVAILRIGTCNPQNRPTNVRHLSTWLSWRDWVHLVQASIGHQGYEYEVVYGCSDNKRKFWDNRNTVIGYWPQDDAEEYAEEVLVGEGKEDVVGDRYHGGPFCSEEYTKGVKKDKVDKEGSQ